MKKIDENRITFELHENITCPLCGQQYTITGGGPGFLILKCESCKYDLQIIVEVWK